MSTLSSCDKLSSIADCESTSEKETAVHSVADQSTPSEKDTAKGNTLYLSETFGLMLDRWSKLNKEFFSAKTSMFDLTKVIFLRPLLVGFIWCLWSGSGCV